MTDARDEALVLEPPAWPEISTCKPDCQLVKSNEAPSDRHVRVLHTLPTGRLAEPLTSDADGTSHLDEDEDALSDMESVSASAASQQQVDLRAMQSHIIAARGEAEQLAKLLELVRGKQYIQPAARDVMPSRLPPPPPAALRSYLLREQLGVVSTQLSQGAHQLRAMCEVASWACTQACALRAHWKILEFTVSSRQLGSISNSWHSLRLELSPHAQPPTQGGKRLAGPSSTSSFSDMNGAMLTVGEAEAAAVAARRIREIGLNANGRGDFCLPQRVGSHTELPHVEYGMRSPRVLPFFVGAISELQVMLPRTGDVSADHADPTNLAARNHTTDDRPSLADTAETHQRLLAAEFASHSRAMVDHMAEEAQSQHVPPSWANGSHAGSLLRTGTSASSHIPHGDASAVRPHSQMFLRAT